jgi:hypothetical protein
LSGLRTALRALLAHGLEVRCGAEPGAGAVRIGDRQRVVGVEAPEGRGELVRGGAVDRIRGLGAVQRDDRHGAVGLVVHGHPSRLLVTSLCRRGSLHVKRPERSEVR